MQSPSDTFHILVVDDFEDITFLLQTFLESKGYSVNIANTADSALEKMQDVRPDLVLLDVMMPGMDGYDLTRKIRRDPLLCSIPIVLITAHIEMCRIKGLAVGATDFIRKPIDFDLLHSTIQNLTVARKRNKHFGSEPEDPHL